MIFYGTSAGRLKDGRLNNVTCPNCETQTSMNYSVFGKYFYIYWIPFFPIGKENVLECNHCKRTYKLSELPEQIKHKFELEKHKGIPIKHFAGIGIIALIVTWFSYSSAKDRELEAEYIKTPLKGDVYRTKGSSPNRYTSAKVVNITSDSIYLMSNAYEVDMKSGIDDIDVEINYIPEYTEGYTLEEVQQLFEDEFIYQIDRD